MKHYVWPTYKEVFSFWKKLHMQLRVAELFNILHPIRSHSFHLTSHHRQLTGLTERQNPKKCLILKTLFTLKGWIQLFLKFFETEVVKNFFDICADFDAPPALKLNLAFVYCVCTIFNIFSSLCTTLIQTDWVWKDVTLGLSKSFQESNSVSVSDLLASFCPRVLLK